MLRLQSDDIRDANRIRRTALLIALGNKCSCHGDDCWHSGDCDVFDPRCLQFDHIHGDGASDRRRTGSTSQLRYYFNHLDEAQENLQILCSNCNWVKRHNNGEVRGGKPVDELKPINQKGLNKALVYVRLTGMPEYLALVVRYRAIRRHLYSIGKADLLRYVHNSGVQEEVGTPMVDFLTIAWEQTHFYGSGIPDLVSFLGEKSRSIDCVSEMMTI